MNDSRDELKAEIESEATSNVLLDELASKDGEITLEDLRQLPSSEGVSDEDLLAAWQDASKNADSAESQSAQEQAAETVAAGTPGAEAVQTPRGWKVYDADGKEIADFSKLSASELLKHQFEYQANGKPHRKTIDELMRVASYGHYNEQKLGRVAAERERFYKELSEARPKLEAMSRNQAAVGYALQQFHLGNEEPLKQLLNAVRQNMGAPPAAAAAEPAASADAEQVGTRVWYEHIQPNADAVAARYGARADEVRNAVRFLIDQEPAETLTWDKIEAIINTEIPMLLEQHGYRAGGAAHAASGANSREHQSNAPRAASDASGTTNEVSALRQQLAELQAKVANNETAAIRNKNRSLPPGSGSSRGEADSDAATIPADVLKSKDAYRKFMRNN